MANRAAKLCGTILACYSSWAMCAGLEPSIGGTLIGGIWSSNRQLDDDPSAVTRTVRIHGSLPLQEDVLLKLDGALGVEDSRSRSGKLHQAREGYLQRKTEGDEIRLGRQLIAWGRADKLNPTDYFTIRDYTMLTSDDEEQKRGVDALRATMHFVEFDIQGVLANGDARNTWPFRSPNNVDLVQSKNQFGLKLDRYGEGLDWSVSFYRGIDRNPNLIPDMATGAAVSSYDDVSAVGADFAVASGALTYRGELACFKTSDSSGNDPYRRNNHLDFVIGADGSPFRDANLGIQYYGVMVNNYSSAVLTNPLAKAGALLGNQLRSFQHGVTLRFAQNWLNDTVQFEWRGSLGLTDRGRYIFPKLTYKTTDHWSVAIGGEHFDGDGNSYFGQFRKNSGVFSEVRFNW